MVRYIKFSYNINKESPAYPGTPIPKIKQIKDIVKGDSCNTFTFTLSNHFGTHVDAPAHFYKNGKKIGGYGLKELIFKKPLIIKCHKEEGEEIGIKDIAYLVKGKPCVLLIKTGFSKNRLKNPYKYSTRNPYVSLEAAEWLRRECITLRAIGIDCISIGSYVNRQEARNTHKELLRESGYRSKPLLIIEDIFIPPNIGKIKELIVSPIFIDGIDSSPCTVIGILND